MEKSILEFGISEAFPLWQWSVFLCFFSIQMFIFLPVSYQVQVEECSRDALYAAHCVFWVHRFLTFHHHILVQVQLPLDRWVL